MSVQLNCIPYLLFRWISCRICCSVSDWTLFGGIVSSRFGKIEAKRGWEFLAARDRITESGEILDTSREGK